VQSHLLLPPGINQQYACVRGRRVLSRASREYKEYVSEMIRKFRAEGKVSDRRVEVLRQGYVGLFADFWFETPRRATWMAV
jgi:hypothetical protein